MFTMQDFDEDEYNLQLSLIGLAPIEFDTALFSAPEVLVIPTAVRVVNKPTGIMLPKRILPPPASAGHFMNMFKPTRKVRSLQFLSHGTFTLKPHLELQFIGQYQPVPDGLCCVFGMFHERWTSCITYECNARGETVLRFTITNVRTGTRTSLVENREERKLRQVSRRVVVICNKVFDQALRAIQGGTYNGCGTKESATLFGLKDEQMRDHVLDWYDDKQ